MSVPGRSTVITGIGELATCDGSGPDGLGLRHDAALLEDAFPKIVAEHRELVASILRSQGVKSHEVDDLSQEVFIALHNQILEERGLRNIPAMLNVIASRRAIDHLRTQACAPFSIGLPS